MLCGPHQENTSIDLWRILSNTIVERKTNRLTTALDFHVSSESVDTAGNPRAWWIAAQLPIQLAIIGPWSVTVRPEFAWDSMGRWTTVEQTIHAFTSALEYRASRGLGQAILRLEHRYDYSTGPDGGFFNDIHPGVIGLTPGQHLLVIGAIVTLDGSFQR